MKTLCKFWLAIAVYAGAAMAANIPATLTLDTPTLLIAPATVYGFGYTLTNNDPVNWIVVSSLDPLIDVPNLLTWDPSFTGFLFPAIAPLGNFSQTPWVQDLDGLAQFTTAASFGSTIFPQFGTFTVNYDFYLGNPDLGGTKVGSSSALVNYTLDLQAVSAPEPGTYALFASGMALLAVLRRRAL